MEELIKIIQNEKTAWEDGEVFITDKVSFYMNRVVKKARKNYFGIFDKEYDPTTGRKKIFVPMTEWTVETVVKNIDLDTKDIKVRSKTGDYKIESLFKHILRSYLDKIHFGKTLNNLIRYVSLDGTAILKARKDGKKAYIDLIDRNNIIVDPSAPSLDDSASIIERVLYPTAEFIAFGERNGYDNLDGIEETNKIDRTGFDRASANTKSEIPYVEVLIRYGYLPKRIITGNDKDTGYEYAMAVLSGIDGEAKVHKIVKKKTHPYQEFKFKEVLNRFDGRGIGEMLFDIQAYVNEIVNTRVNTNRINQLGLWEVRGNITPQQLKKLFQTSAIKTNQEGDIQRLNTGTIDPSSYADENNAYGWGQRVTQAQREDEMAGDKPATNALIEERGASKAYDLVMEGIMLNLSKFLEEKFIPIVQEVLTEKELISITADPGDLMKIQEPFVRNYIYSKLLEYRETYGIIPLTKEEIEMQIADLNQQLSQQGDRRFIEYTKEAFNTEHAINIEPREEQINLSVMANQLVQVIGILASQGVDTKDVAKELFSVMGLDADKLTQNLTPPMQAGDMQKAPEQQERVPKPVENIPNRQGI